MVFLFEPYPLGLAKLPHGLAQVTEVLSLREKFVVYLVLKVYYCPREDVILREVVETSPAELIYLHQILEVGNESLLPFLNKSFELGLDPVTIYYDSFLQDPQKLLTLTFAKTEKVAYILRI